MASSQRVVGQATGRRHASALQQIRQRDRPVVSSPAHRGSDYIVGKPYTYDDQAPGQTDPHLSDFSIRHDKAYLLPVIRQALELNPRIKVMANPWTPPAWMKTDDQLVTTTGPAGQLRPQYYATYARYLVKFLKAYRRHGVPVHYLDYQNDPLTPLYFVAGIPESYLGPIEAGVLVHDYLAPALKHAGLAPKIHGLRRQLQPF